MKKLLIVVALFLFAIPVFANDMDDYVKLLKTDIRAEAKDIVAKGMQTFTPEEAKRFWPVYDAYLKDLGNFFDARVELIKDYADNYDKMTDAKAQELLNRRQTILRLRTHLDETYRPKFATTLSPRRLVRFYQIQHEMDLLMELEVISNTPHMKWWQGE
jgi:hypothetical protein